MKSENGKTLSSYAKARLKIWIKKQIKKELKRYHKERLTIK
jgi:hypothetical protein